MADHIEGLTQGDYQAFADVLTGLEEHRRSIDQLQYRVVGMMRRSGCTWETIGEELGISRQAAQKRFSQQRHRR